MTLFVGRYESQECEIELENISMDDNGNWTCIILESFSTNQTDQDTVNVKVIDYGVVPVVEFSSVGTKLKIFLPKNQHTQRKLLNFENWCKWKASKSAKI